MSGHWRNLEVAVSVIVLGCLFSMQGFASDRAGLSDAAFGRFASELERIENGKHAAAAIVEIGIAKKLVKDGRLLFREGSIRTSAIIAERLPAQIELIRALIVAETASHDAVRMEREVRDMKLSLDILRKRYNKILSRLTPAVASAVRPLERGEK